MSWTPEGWGWLPVVLMVGYLLNGLRLRARVRALPVLGARTAPPSPAEIPPAGSPGRLVSASGVETPEETRAAAAAYAAQERLEVLDLVPADLPVHRALDFARAVDPVALRRKRLAPGRGAYQTLLVDAEVLERAQVDQVRDLDPVRMAQLTTRLKRYAAATTGTVVAPGLRAGPSEPEKRGALLREVHPPPENIAIGLPVLVFAALLVSVPLNPVWAALAALTFSLQPYLAFGGRVPLAPRDLHRVALLRLVHEPLLWVRTFTGRWRPPAQGDPYEERRAAYAADLEAGIERFFEPRAEECPWCGGAELTVHVVAPELVQCKPGRFTLERCANCQHIFQNPRLTLEGLEFYYRDFYDGLGAEDRSAAFGANDRPYRERAETVRPFTSPKRWLDVGLGHGHFCNVAHEVWPETSFDGLDLSAGVEEAARRRWIDRGYRGLFPELAPELAGQYDVISMHHYLEHAREPFLELDAAAKVLGDGGLLLIEVPNPASRFAKLLGGMWLPWSQPQHLHMFPVDNLLQALEGRGFTPVSVQRGKANEPHDVTWAVTLWFNTRAPDPKLPWIERPATPLRKVGRSALFTAGLPVVIAAVLVDAVIGVFVGRSQGGNTYRVLARKDG